MKTQFQLTNLVALTFSGLTNPNVKYGSNATFAGSLSSSTGPQPGGSVLVTVDGISQSAAIHGGGAFSVTLNTASLPVSSTPYSVSYSYTGDQMFASAVATAQLTVSPAPLIITVANATSTYGGALPAFTVSYSGFVNSETAANLTTAPCSRPPPHPRAWSWPAVTRSRPAAPSIPTTPSRTWPARSRSTRPR